MVDQYIEDYDEKTVDEIKTIVEDDHYDDLIAIEDIAEYEAANKDRVTLLEWLEDRLDTLYEQVDHGRSDLVVVAAQRGGYIAGMWFDAAHETRRVKKNVRIEEAIAEGTLRVVDSR